MQTLTQQVEGQGISCRPPGVALLVGAHTAELSVTVGLAPALPQLPREELEGPSLCGLLPPPSALPSPANAVSSGDCHLPCARPARFLSPHSATVTDSTDSLPEAALSRLLSFCRFPFSLLSLRPTLGDTVSAFSGLSTPQPTPPPVQDGAAGTGAAIQIWRLRAHLTGPRGKGFT